MNQRLVIFITLLVSVVIAISSCTSPAGTKKLTPGSMADPEVDQGIYYALPKTELVVSYTAVRVKHKANKDIFDTYRAICPKSGDQGKVCYCDISSESNPPIRVRTLETPAQLDKEEENHDGWRVKPDSVKLRTRNVPDEKATFYVNVDQSWLGTSMINLTYLPGLALSDAKSSHTSPAKEAIPIIFKTIMKTIALSNQQQQNLLQQMEEAQRRLEIVDMLRSICGAKKSISKLYGTTAPNKEALAESVGYWKNISKRLASNIFTTSIISQDRSITWSPDNDGGQEYSEEIVRSGCLLKSGKPVSGPLTPIEPECSYGVRITLSPNLGWAAILDSVRDQGRTKLKEDKIGFRYRMPGRYSANLEAGPVQRKNWISTQDVEIAQTGKIIALPKDFGGFENEVELSFTESGALKTFILNAEGTSAREMLTPIHDELTTDHELERAKREKEYWEAKKAAQEAREAVEGDSG